MKCLICNSESNYFFSKTYTKYPFKEMMAEIGTIDYYKCKECGFTLSKTHSELDSKTFEKLNYDFHHYLENNSTSINQPPYLEQAMLINILIKNSIIDGLNMLDFAGGYGTLSKILEKYFKINLPVYDPYIQLNIFNKYIKKEDLSTYKTVIISALFEHLLNRQSFDDIESLVSKDKNSTMIIHTVICENIPNNSEWFYIEPPVHSTFHTNKSMSILMNQWGYKASIYCLSAKSWILLKDTNDEIKLKIDQINKEFQREYLIYKEGFVDYWK